MPADFPPWPTVYYYFSEWTADGTWQRVSDCWTIEACEQVKKCPAHGSHPRQSKREEHGHQHPLCGLRRGQTR
ncbi:transposase [Hymenobacter swuensis]|uniref:transposase n=1 Tax=Hymenobacter swuensis TaxID=1446467 RepID=UPI0009DDD8A6